MLGYICKYTPVEVFAAMGAEMVRVEPKVANFNQAEMMLHGNTCSFVKAVLEDMAERPEDYEGLILTTCCDSVRRLYDTLKQQYPDKFFYLLDLPRKVNDFACTLYERHVREMVEAYCAYSKKTFDEDALRHELKKGAAAAALKKAPEGKKDLKVGLAGARCGQEIRNLLENSGAEVLFDLTCTGLERSFGSGLKKDLWKNYAADVLNQVPCMRMMEASGRDRFIEGYADRLDGIIYHTVKFCDMYSYEYVHLKGMGQIPLAAVETDATAQCAGQIRTRVEAFLEALRQKKGIEKRPEPSGRERKHMYVIGVDSGSTSTNAVVLNDRKEIVAYEVLRTGAKSGDSAQRILERILDKAGIRREDVTKIVSTGYGRVSIPYADDNVTEISCHGKGAHYLNPKVRTILDIGGQDSKAIRLDENGDVIDFVMNDKCAAGTGRFLEMMARTLEISIDELGPVSLQWKEAVEISSMCSVFAESEVISLIALNKEKSDIAHGIHEAIAGKAVSLMKRVRPEGAYMMTGGVAKNLGVVKALEEKLGEPLYIYEEPEIVGALGAALYGMEG